MARVVLTALADSDTAQIINDLSSEAGQALADRYDADFDEVYRRLEVFPRSGAPRPALGKHARICIVLPYLIVYDYSEPDDIVTVLRILHGKRSITRRLLRGRPQRSTKVS